MRWSASCGFAWNSLVHHPWRKYVFLNQKSLDLRSFIHAWTHSRTSFPHLGNTPWKDKFWREFSNIKMCVQLHFSPFDYLWRDTMILSWCKFYFCSLYQERNPPVCDFVWNHDAVPIFAKKIMTAGNLTCEPDLLKYFRVDKTSNQGKNMSGCQVWNGISIP